MQCPNCFSNIPDSSSACPICKKSLSQQSGNQNSSLYPNWQNQTPQPPPQPQPQPQQQPQYQPSPPQYQTTGAAILDGKKRKLMIWSIISLFICVPVGIYGLVKHSSISKIADPAKAVNEADHAAKIVIIWTVVLLVLSIILGYLLGLN